MNTLVERVDAFLAGADLGLVFVLLFALGLYEVYTGIGLWQHKRLVQKTPTEQVGLADGGRTELEGTGQPIGDPLDRPFGDGECLVAVYEIEQYKATLNRGRWKTLETGIHVNPFHLDDRTGRILVEPDEETTFEIGDEHTRQIESGPDEPESAEVIEFLRRHTDHDVPSRDGAGTVLYPKHRRYTERWIPPGEVVYAFGSVERSDDGDLVLRRDGTSGEFLIADRTGADLLSELRWRIGWKVVGGLGLSAGMVALLLRYSI